MARIVRNLEKKKDYLVVVSVRALGNLLIFGSILAILITFWPVISTEVTYRFQTIVGTKFNVKDSTIVEAQVVPGDETRTFRDLINDSENTTYSSIVPKSTTFGVVVEKIGANAQIIPNVDPGNRVEYDAALKQGIAHAKGSVYPGQKGVSYLFSHSTLNAWDVPRYNAIFYLLRELVKGDRIITYFNDVRYDYIVDEKVVVASNDLSYYHLDTQEPLLIMQTCDPPGTTWKRLLVIAKLANPDGAKVPVK